MLKNINYKDSDFMESVCILFNKIINNEIFKKYHCIHLKIIYYFKKYKYDTEKFLEIIYQFKIILNKLQILYLDYEENNLYKNEQQLLSYSNMLMKYNNIEQNIHFKNIIHYLIIKNVKYNTNIENEKKRILILNKISDVKNKIYNEINKINVSIYFNYVYEKMNNSINYKKIFDKVLNELLNNKKKK